MPDIMLTHDHTPTISVEVRVRFGLPTSLVFARNARHYAHT